MEKMHSLLVEMYKDRQWYSGRSELVGTSTGKRKVRTYDINEEEEGETYLNAKTGVGQGRIKFKMLEMLVFNGDNLDGWFYRAEHYFQLHLLTEQEKLKIIVVRLEGKGLSWFHWVENKKRFRSWRELKERIYRRFRCREQGTRCARFLAIRQEGMVNDYLQKFEELSALLPEMAEDVLEGTFTNGLDSIIRMEVFAMRAMGLEDMMDAARLAGEKIEMVRIAQGPIYKRCENGPKTLSEKYRET